VKIFRYATILYRKRGGIRWWWKLIFCCQGTEGIKIIKYKYMSSSGGMILRKSIIRLPSGGGQPLRAADQEFSIGLSIDFFHHLYGVGKAVDNLVGILRKQ